jgi:hypothetical protein
MKLLDLALLYLVAGAACAVALYRRAPVKNRAALVNALTAVPLWPLWAPIAWTARREAVDLDLRSQDRVARIRRALDEGVEAVLGTPLERVLHRESAKAIAGEVERLAARYQELLTLLGRDEFSLELAEHRLSSLNQAGASARMRGSARLHLENVRRLQQLAERDARVLEELQGLADALRTQLVLVRLSGSSAEGACDIVNELLARIEGLSEAESGLARDLSPYAENPA